MSEFKFMTVFRTSLVEGTPLKVVSDPVKIEVFKGSRTYRVPFQEWSVLPKARGGLISKDVSLVLDPHSCHIVVTARTEESNPVEARRICEDASDRVITSLSLVYKPEIFSDLIYRGWLLGEKTGVMDAWVKISEPVTLNEKALSAELKDIVQEQSRDAEILNRFTLMSRFYSRTLSQQPSEEKFILLWTILEIFPMKDTTDIKPIAEYLAPITGREPETIKAKLDIGRLYGSRCSLVHNGQFDIELKDMGIVFTKLENIIYEIMRAMTGLAYSGSLDRFLA